MSSVGALDHSTRRLIFSYVTNHPGAAFGAIQEALSLTEGTLRYHLQYLERHGIVQSRPMGKYRCYYPEGRAVSGIIHIPSYDPEKLTELQRRILELVRQNPGTSVSELEALSDINRRVLQYNLKVLKDQMILWRVGNGRSTQYEITTKERIHEELSRLLIEKYLKDELDEKTYLKLKGEIERERMKE